MSRLGPVFAFLLLGLGLAGCNDAGAGDSLPAESTYPGLRPGQAITLSAPPEVAAQLAQTISDPVSGVTIENPSGFRSDVVGERIGARARALDAFAVHGGKVYRYWDIEIPDEPTSWAIRNQRFDTVLQAQVSGTFNLRGFLFVVGYGRASVSVDLTLYDRGTEDEPTDPPKPIYGANLTEHVLDPNVGLNAAIDLKVLGGAPFVGLAGGFSVGFDMPIAVEVVRDEISFGFQSLLQRGHQYRVQIDLTVEARQAAAPGFPSLSFFMGGSADPDNAQLAQVDPTSESENAELGDPFDPDFWIDGVHDLMEARFPLLEGKGLHAFENKPRFYFPEITVEYFKESKTWGDQFVNLSNFPEEFMPSLFDTDVALAAVSPLEIPRSFEDLVRGRLATRNKEEQPKAKRRLEIDRPGLEFPHGITVTLATDTVEEIAARMAQDQ